MCVVCVRWLCICVRCACDGMDPTRVQSNNQKHEAMVEPWSKARPPATIYLIVDCNSDTPTLTHSKS